ncbi:hypothetical protein OG203_38040 [Nocardia sp. NBC_01499]
MTDFLDGRTTGRMILVDGAPIIYSYLNNAVNCAAAKVGFP